MVVKGKGKDQSTERGSVNPLNPVHTINNVEATLSNARKSNVACFEKVERFFDFVVVGYDVERVFHEILFFRQSRNKLNMSLLHAFNRACDAALSAELLTPRPLIVEQ